jgi:hypothetical protein
MRLGPASTKSAWAGGREHRGAGIPRATAQRGGQGEIGLTAPSSPSMAASFGSCSRWCTGRTPAARSMFAWFARSSDEEEAIRYPGGEHPARGEDSAGVTRPESSKSAQKRPRRNSPSRLRACRSQSCATSSRTIPSISIFTGRRPAYQRARDHSQSSARDTRPRRTGLAWM